jgi:hypothetical protein
MTKQIRVKLGYDRLSHKDLAMQAVATVDGMTNNAKLPNPPVSPADLKVQVEIYISLIAAANDGGKGAKIERDQQREVVVRMLRRLGHWVEANCDDDPAILQSSGYQQAAATYAPSLPLAGPPSFRVESGSNSGQVVVRGRAVPKAVHYLVRYAPMGADGKPGMWTELPSTVIRSITVDGLTPGTTYAFQVRAFGRLGLTDWSDSVTRISM